MIKKILYSIGGIFGSLVLIGIITPEPTPEEVPIFETQSEVFSETSGIQLEEVELIEHLIFEEEIASNVYSPEQTKEKSTMISPERIEIPTIIQKQDEQFVTEESQYLYPVTDVTDDKQNDAPSSSSTITSGAYYTSSYHTAKLWYPESCDGWKGLSEKYLVSYNTLEELLKRYPYKTKSPQCN